MSRPTIPDLAKAARVSISTVDRVLNGRDPVRPQTADRVLAAAREIGFHGVVAIERRIERDKPVLKLGFLLKQSHRKLYQMWGQVLTEATVTYPKAHGRPIVRFMDDLAPDKAADAIYSLSREADVIGMITSDHPQVNHAVDHLAVEGIPVVTMISDISTSSRAAYVGNDCVKKGRTAAWFIAGLGAGGGKVAVFVGSHRYLAQELNEMAFRSYFRESGANFHMLETVATLEEPDIAYGATRRLLREEPDLIGLYVAGGGVTGVMRALRDDGGAVARRLTVVAHELTDETRAGLAEGLIRVVLSHPAKLLAETLVKAMAEACEDPQPASVQQHIVPFDFYTATNI